MKSGKLTSLVSQVAGQEFHETGISHFHIIIFINQEVKFWEGKKLLHIFAKIFFSHEKSRQLCEDDEPVRTVKVLHSRQIFHTIPTD